MFSGNFLFCFFETRSCYLFLHVQELTLQKRLALISEVHLYPPPPPQVMALKVFPTMPRQVLAIMTSTGKLYQGCNKPSLSHQCVWLSKSDSRQIGFLPLLVWDGVPREVVLENLVTFLVHFQKNKRVKKVTKGRKPKRAPRGNEMERVKNKGRWLMT